MGVTAFADATAVNGSSMSATGASTAATIEIHGVSITLQATANSNDVEMAATRQSVIAAINAVSDQTGVVASDGGNENGVILTAEDGRNIVLEGTGGNLTTAFGLATATTTAGASSSSLSGTTAGVYEGGYTLIADGDTKSIDIDGGYGTGTGTTAATLAIAEGDLVINGTTISASSSVDDTASDTTSNSSDGSASGIAIAAAINRSTEQTGVTATVNETVLVGTTGAAPTTAATQGTTLAIAINNVDIGTVVSQGDIDKDRQSTIDAINAKSGQTGVTAEDNGEGITLRAADGRNISVAIGGTAAAIETGGAFGLDADVEGIGQAPVATTLSAFATSAEIVYSSVRLESASTITIEAGSSGKSGLDDSGFTLGEFGGGEDGQFLVDIDISTFEGATAALTAVDNAIAQVASQRADLGK